MQLTQHAHTAYSTTSLEVLVLLKSKTLSHDREFTLVESGEQSPQRVHQGLPLPWCRWWNSSHGKLDKMMGNPAMHVCAQINQYWLVLRISDIWVSQIIMQTARGQGAVYLGNLNTKCFLLHRVDSAHSVKRGIWWDTSKQIRSFHDSRLKICLIWAFLLFLNSAWCWNYWDFYAFWFVALIGQERKNQVKRGVDGLLYAQNFCYYATTAL